MATQEQVDELVKACDSFCRLYGRLWDVVEPAGAGFLSPESVKDYDDIHGRMQAALDDIRGEKH
ncbi:MULTISPECIES: hypothetical protein [Pseudomonas]|mgnify:CR=1 FL=1|uniref:hypothetical protein n=1 Tax=Pseudomonas TaxID=286 RepID=UPI00215E30B5|nr:hypothetical protein [Pseudomonas sp. B21-036]UVL48936.1 hypothetical protein LOY33_13090 [Pseudomonas sp. B21-036]